MLVLTEPIAAGAPGSPLAQHGRSRRALRWALQATFPSRALPRNRPRGEQYPLRRAPPNHRFLRRSVGRGEPAAASVLVDRRAADHRQDPVAIGLRRGERLSTTTPQPSPRT